MEKAKARLRQITNPTPTPSHKSPANKTSMSSTHFNISGLNSKKRVQSNCSTLLSQPNDDQLYYFRALNHVGKGLNITEPSVIDQINRTVENIPLANLNLQPPFEQTQQARKRFCHERKQLQQLSRWLNQKMQSFRNHQQFDLSIFVDYRQYVVNIVLGKLMNIFRKYSIEATELMSQLWTKTFSFMQFLLELFSNNNSKKDKQLMKLQKAQEELHIKYIQRINKEQQQHFNQNKHLQKSFRNSILNNRQLKRKCTHLNRSYWEERHRRKQIQDGLIKSLHLNMQLASGQNFEWSHKVFKTMLNTYKQFNKNPCKVTGTKFKQYDDYQTEEVIKQHLSDLKQSHLFGFKVEEQDQFESFIQQIKSDNIKKDWSDLAIKEIMDMDGPKNAFTSTKDLYELRHFGTQSVIEQAHQVCNTHIIYSKENSTQCRVLLKQQGTQTAKDNSIVVAPAPQRQLPKRNASILKSKIIYMHTSPNETVSHLSKDLQIEKKIEDNDIKEPKQTAKKKSSYNIHASLVKSRYSVKPTVQQRKQEKKHLLTDTSFGDEFIPGMNFSQIYSHHKRKLLENTENFQKSIMHRRSFYRPQQLSYTIQSSRDISFLDNIYSSTPRKKRDSSNVWPQDQFIQQQMWINALKEVKQKITSPANATMATANLFRMFSLTIQTLARRYKHNNTQQLIQSKSKTLTKITTKNVQPLKYIIMRRLYDILGFQFSDKELRHLINNLLFLKRSKELEMFSLLMGLTEGYSQIGANELQLYVRAFSLLDVFEKFQIEKDTRTTFYLLNEKFGELCDGYFEPEERGKLLQKLGYSQGSSICIDEFAKTFVRRYTEKKRLSFDSYEYLYECYRYFSSNDMYHLIKHLKISMRAKAVMMREFHRLIDCCSSKKEKYISYQKFWTFCEKVKFPSRSVILGYCRRQSAKAKDVLEYCKEDVCKVVDLMAIHNVKIPPIILRIVNLLTRLAATNHSKIQFWTHFLICFCHYEILDHKIMRLLPSGFEHFETAYLRIETTM